MHQKIENERTLLRDGDNNAILNTDKQALHDYRAEKRRRSADSQRLDNVVKDVEEIKSLLKAVLEQLGK